MSNGEVKRWTILKVADDEFYLDDGERPDSEYSEIKVMPVEDHERIVAEKDREIQHWRGVYMGRPLAKCYEIAQEQITTQKHVITELERINRTFAWHYDDCTLNTEVDSEECSCGLIEAMNKLEDLKKL